MKTTIKMRLCVLIVLFAKTTEMQSLAVKEGMVTLVQDGILKVLAGLTIYEQVRAVAMK